MPVVDKYAQANKEAENGKKFPALNGTGTQTFTASGTAIIDAADDDTSKFRILSDIPSNAVPLNLCIHHDSITNGTDYDVGLFKVNKGDVIDADILADGLNLSVGSRGIETWNNAGMSAIDLANGNQTLAELSGQADPSPSYDIVLTANAIGSLTAEVRFTFTYALK